MEPNRKIIKQYFLKNDIHLVSLYNNDNSLMILYKKGSPKFEKKGSEYKDESKWTIAEKHIKSYIKKQNKDALLRTEVDGWTDIEIPVKNPSSNPTTLILTISLIIIVGIVLLGGLIIFLRTKKGKSKIK